MSLSSLAGIIASDGHLAKDNSTIYVINKDKKFIEDVQNMLEMYCGKRGKYKSAKSGFGSDRYLLRVNSAKLVKQLNKVYNVPIGNKSATIVPPNINQKESLEYIGGWIAGDGSVTIDRTRPKIEIWSKSSAIIHWVKDILEKETIESRLFTEKKKNMFILRIGKKEAVKKFYSKVIIPHHRKQIRLQQLCS